MKEFTKEERDLTEEVSKIKESGLAFTNIPNVKSSFLFSGEWTPLAFNEETGTDPFEVDES